MKYITGNTFAELYQKALYSVCIGFENIVNPRGLKIKECTNVMMELTNPLSNLFKNPIRDLPLKYLCGELHWCFTGSNSVDDINKFSKFWNNIKNSNGTVNSAYGWMLFERGRPFITEWEWAYESLLNDIDSRQAIIHFNTPKYMQRGIKDFPCTLDGTFQIRDNMLNFTVVMRSQDVIKGLTFDLPFFTMLQQNMCILLKRKYPKLKLGKFNLLAESLHIYESDFKLGYKMMLHLFKPAMLPPMFIPLIESDLSYGLKKQFLYENDSLMSFIIKTIGDNK